MKRITTTALVLIFLCVFTNNTLAWNRHGHLIVSAVAYIELQKNNPDTLSKINEIFKSHPAYQLWKSEYAKYDQKFKAETPLEAYVFIRAAAWPDDVRSPKNNPEHHDTWHYVNYPVRLTGSIEFDKSLPKENIFFAVNEALKVLQNAQAKKSNKAKKLCWLFHAIGDVHQPLHTVARFSDDFKQGDRGGNLFCVRPSINSSGIELHSYWDDLTGDEKSVVWDVRQAWLDALFLPSQMQDLKPSNFPDGIAMENWAKESANLALRDTYQFNDSSINGLKKNGEVCPKIPDSSVLSDSYNKNAQKLANRRVIIAGYRLASSLKQLNF